MSLHQPHSEATVDFVAFGPTTASGVLSRIMRACGTLDGGTYASGPEVEGAVANDGARIQLVEQLDLPLDAHPPDPEPFAEAQNPDVRPEHRCPGDKHPGHQKTPVYRHPPVELLEASNFPIHSLKEERAPTSPWKRWGAYSGNTGTASGTTRHERDVVSCRASVACRRAYCCGARRRGRIRHRSE